MSSSRLSSDKSSEGARWVGPAKGVIKACNKNHERTKTHQTVKAVGIRVSLSPFSVKGSCEHPVTSHHQDC
jgi:hypothetical protein